MSSRAAAPYFPPVPRESLELEARVRAVSANLQEKERSASYEDLSRTHEHFCPTRFDFVDGSVVARQSADEIWFPRPLPLVKFSHILCGYETWLEHKYSLPGFVAVEPNDVVIDCGAYVGGFSLSASRLARQVHAFEPEAANFRCLTHNLRGRSNVVLCEKGLYVRTQEVTLNISASSVEHSLLMPDDGEPIDRRTISVVALKDYCSENELAAIDFLKLEAEGVELEIFEGLGDVRPRKLAIDVSPEREGLSPAQDFQRLLPPLGYEICQRGNVLFARLA